MVLPPLEADPLFVDAVDDAIAIGVDSDLEARPLRGDGHDFASLYIRHRSSLELHVRRFLRDGRDVDEVLQEGFLRLFLALPEIEDELQALRFCRRALTNLCIDRYRASQRRPAVVDLEEDMAGEHEDVDPVVAAEDAAFVREALALLSPLHRAALVKWEIEEKPASVVAEELDIPPEQVKYVVYRARRAFRRVLTGLEGFGRTAIKARGGAVALLLVAVVVVGPVAMRLQVMARPTVSRSPRLRAPSEVRRSPAAGAVPAGAAPAGAVPKGASRPFTVPPAALPRSQHRHSIAPTWSRRPPAAPVATAAAPVEPVAPASEGSSTVRSPRPPAHHRRPRLPARHGPGPGGAGPNAGTPAGRAAGCDPCASLATTVEVTGTPTLSVAPPTTSADGTAVAGSLFQAQTAAGTLVLDQQMVDSPTAASSLTVTPTLVVNGVIVDYQVQGSATTITPQAGGSLDVALFSRSAVPTTGQGTAPVLQSLAVELTYGGPTLSSLQSEQVVVAILPSAPAPGAPATTGAGSAGGAPGVLAGEAVVATVVPQAAPVAGAAPPSPPATPSGPAPASVPASTTEEVAATGKSS